MNRSPLLPLLLLVAAGCAYNGSAASPHTLQLGTAVAGDIPCGEAHYFTFETEADSVVVNIDPVQMSTVSVTCALTAGSDFSVACAPSLTEPSEDSVERTIILETDATTFYVTLAAPPLDDCSVDYRLKVDAVE